MLQLVIGLLVCFLLQANCEVQRTMDTKNTYMPFYRLFTPRDIQSAELTTPYYNYSLTAITFEGGISSYSRLFKIPLVGGDVLAYSADITVIITVGLQKAIRTGDSDPKFLLSDGDYGIGFEMREELYADRCRGIQGSMGDVLGSPVTFDGADHIAPILPEEFVLTISPTKHWGSCYHAVDSGLISPVSFTRRIDPRKGLCLEVYGEGTSEKYLFNYIIVEIHEN